MSNLVPSSPSIAGTDAPPSGEEWLATLDGPNLDWLLELCEGDDDLRPAGLEEWQASADPLDAVIIPVLLPGTLNDTATKAPATRAMVKEDTSSGSDTASSSASPVSGRSRTRAKSPSRGSVWPPKRATPKQRIEALRVQVSKLTLELNTMKETAGIDLETPVARIPPSCSSTEITVAASDDAQDLGLWRKVAERQRQQRRRVEDDNRALREAVSTHARRAKHLRQLAEKLENDKCQLSRMALNNAQSIVPTCLADDEAVYERLSIGIDELYANVDHHFHKVGMHEVPRPGRLSSARRVGPEEWNIEIRDVMILPFDMKRTDRAVWIHRTGSAGRHNSREVRRSFRFGIDHMMATKLSQQQRSVIRRYCEGDRTVIIHRQQIEPIHGMMVDVTVQMVVKRGADTVSGPTSEVDMSILGKVFATVPAQVFVFNALERLNPSGASEDVFTATIWQKWDKAISAGHDKVESMLVEEAAGLSSAVH